MVFMGDVVVGTVSLQWEDIRTWGSDAVEAGYMHKLAIKNGLRGLGVGERVIEWVKRTVTDSGRDTLRLDCEDANSKLCSYYEKLGFIKAGTKSILEGDGYVAALCEMRLSSKDKPNR